MSAARVVGPWTLHEKLGKGGNADVWRARRGDEEVALAESGDRLPEQPAQLLNRHRLDVVLREVRPSRRRAAEACAALAVG